MPHRIDHRVCQRGSLVCRRPIHEGHPRRRGRRRCHHDLGGRVEVAVHRRIEQIVPKRSAHGEDGAARREVREHVLEQARGDLALHEHGSRRRAFGDALDEVPRGLRRREQVARDRLLVENDLVDVRRAGPRRRLRRFARELDGPRQLLGQRALEIAHRQGGARGRDHEASRADPEHGGDHALAAPEAPVARCARRALRSAVPDLELVEERGVAHAHARVGPLRADKLEQAVDGEVVEPPAHLALAAEPRLDARAGAEDLANARDDGARVALLAEVRRGARAELAHPLEEVFLPRQQDHRHVAEGHVPPDGPAEREAVQPRHQDVAHDELGRVLVGELERHLAVERLVDDAAGRAQEVGDEPRHARVVVGDDDDALVEAHVGGGASAPPGSAVRACHVLVQPRRHRHGALRPGAGVAHGAIGAHRHDLTDAGDGSPHRAEHLRPLAERNARPAPGLVDRVDQRATHLLGETIGQLLERRLAQRHADGAALALIDHVLARVLEHRRRDGLGERLGDAERDEAGSLLGRAEAAEHDDGHGLGQRVVEERLDEIERARQVAVDDDDVGREGAREPQTGLGVLGALALEDERLAFLGERVGEVLAAHDEGRQGVLGERDPARSGLGDGRRLRVRRLSPREGGQIVQRLREPEQVLVGGLPDLRRVVQHGGRLRDAAGHGVEVEHARAGAQRVQLAPQLVPRRAAGGIGLERGQDRSRVQELASERRHEIRACPAEARPRLGSRSRRRSTRSFVRAGVPRRPARRLRLDFAGHLAQLPWSGRARPEFARRAEELVALVAGCV